MELGVGLMAIGLLLAPLTSEPWHLYLTLGVLVGGGSVCLGYSGQSLFLPNWFVRRRGMAIGIAFAGVGVGSITLLPWVQLVIEGAGWRAACMAMGTLLLVVLAPINLLLRQRPEDSGLLPDGDAAPNSSSAPQPSNVVNEAWAAVDWTLAGPCVPPPSGGSRSRISPASMPGTRCRCTRPSTWWRSGSARLSRAWALGLVSLFGIPGQIALGHISDRHRPRVDMDGQ
jgi:sugar phosphate permease